MESIRHSCEEVFLVVTGAGAFLRVSADLMTFLGGELRFGSISPKAIACLRFFACFWLGGEHDGDE